jgi:hypothetical protein
MNYEIEILKINDNLKEIIKLLQAQAKIQNECWKELQRIGRKLELFQIEFEKEKNEKASVLEASESTPQP